MQLYMLRKSAINDEEVCADGLWSSEKISTELSKYGGGSGSIGVFNFEIENGRLILTTPDEGKTPDMYINENGHLVWEI